MPRPRLLLEGERDERKKMTASRQALLATGGARRHTHGTLMNAQSSRSHLVLTLHATCKNEADGVEMRGKLHLVSG